MNTTIIGLIALVTFAWTLFLQRIDSPDAVAEATQLKNERPIKYEQKVLGATFRQGKHIGYWYEREGRLDIFRSDKLVKTLYLVEESRAEFYFKRWVRSNK